MGISITVLYPNDVGSKFDMNYYLDTHCPLVKEKWGPAGMTSLKVVKGAATPDPDTPPPYQIVAMLEFESMEAFQGAVAEHGAAVMGDIPNFTDVAPVIQINELIL